MFFFKSSSALGNQRYGFSLIEAAVVLGVVGLVIGGIWVAAAAVHRSQMIGKSLEDIKIIIENINNTVSTMDSIAIGHQVYITTEMVRAGVFPHDLVQSDGSVTNRYGGKIKVNNLVAGTPVQTRYQLVFTSVPADACVEIVTRVGTMANMASARELDKNSWNPFLRYVAIKQDDGDWQAPSVPVSFEDASRECNEADYNGGFVLGFSYARVN